MCGEMGPDAISFNLLAIGLFWGDLQREAYLETKAVDLRSYSRSQSSRLSRTGALASCERRTMQFAVGALLGFSHFVLTSPLHDLILGSAYKLHKRDWVGDCIRDLGHKLSRREGA